jgi:hypothetical protein
MNIYLEKHDIDLILDALKDYKIEIEHWANCKSIQSNFYPWTENQVGNLVKYLTNTLENN